jgi:hypothetical protein
MIIFPAALISIMLAGARVLEKEEKKKSPFEAHSAVI